MPDRVKRFYLLLCSGVFIVVGMSMIAGAFLVEITIPAETEVSDSGVWLSPPSAKPADVDFSASDFTHVWTKPLQGPMVDAKTEKPKPKVAATRVVNPEIQIRAVLVGTLVDSDPKYARAWLETDGKQQVVQIGQVIKGHQGNPTLQVIEDRSVTILMGSSLHRISLRDSELNFQSDESQGGRRAQ